MHEIWPTKINNLIPNLSCSAQILSEKNSYHKFMGPIERKTPSSSCSRYGSQSPSCSVGATVSQQNLYKDTLFNSPPQRKRGPDLEVDVKQNRYNTAPSSSIKSSPIPNMPGSCSRQIRIDRKRSKSRLQETNRRIKSISRYGDRRSRSTTNSRYSERPYEDNNIDYSQGSRSVDVIRSPVKREPPQFNPNEIKIDSFKDIISILKHQRYKKQQKIMEICLQHFKQKHKHNDYSDIINYVHDFSSVLKNEILKVHENKNLILNIFLWFMKCAGNYIPNDLFIFVFPHILRKLSYDEMKHFSTLYFHQLTDIIIEYRLVFLNDLTCIIFSQPINQHQKVWFKFIEFIQTYLSHHFINEKIFDLSLFLRTLSRIDLNNLYKEFQNQIISLLSLLIQEFENHKNLNIESDTARNLISLITLNNNNNGTEYINVKQFLTIFITNDENTYTQRIVEDSQPKKAKTSDPNLECSLFLNEINTTQFDTELEKRNIIVKYVHT
eukprot:UN29583